MNKNSCEINSSDNEKKFKKVMSNFATGICVITTFCEKNLMHGITINSFNSVSLDPSLILYSLGKKSLFFDLFLNAEYFYINILNEDQAEISNFFAFKKNFEAFHDYQEQIIDDKKFAIINNSVAGIACKKYANYNGGDHKIILGEAVHFNINSSKETKPLIYFQSNYQKLQ